MYVSHIGSIAILVAFPIALYVVAAGVLGARRGQTELVSSTRNGVLAVAALLTIAGLALFYSLFSRDFGVRYVADQVNLTMPTLYVVTAFWGGQQGSLLFWAWSMALFSALVVIASWQGNGRLMPYVMAVCMGIEAFFLLVLIFYTSPFERLFPVPADGRGMNPLLLDRGMLLHPPFLLLGYMSVSIPYAFAMAALITGRLDSQWLRSTRRYALVSWAFLSLGNLYGMWWAYHVLGWGGHWGWDPVENSSLLPWLTSSAYLHSVIVQERRGMLKLWNMGLIIATFALAIQGTFFVRSGVLSSVHAFAQSAIGPLFFIFLGVTLVASLLLLLRRLPLLKDEREFEALASRESGFLLNNLLFAGVAFATYWGTIFPLVSEAVRGVKATVGAPFYNQVNGPLLLALVALMGIGPLLPWRKASQKQMRQNFLYPLVAAGLTATLLVILGLRQPAFVVALATCAFVTGTIIWEYYRGIQARRRSTGENPIQALLSLMGKDQRRYGGYVVHLGIIFIAVGIVSSSFYKIEREVTLTPGQQAEVGQYTLTYQGLSEDLQPNHRHMAASLAVMRDGQAVGQMEPGKKFYRTFEKQPTSEIAIKTIGMEDLYIVLSGWTDDGTATFMVFVNPLENLIWIGGTILIIGALVCVWPQVREEGLPAPRPARVIRQRQTAGEEVSTR